MALEKLTVRTTKKTTEKEEEEEPLSPFSRLFQVPELTSFVIVTLGCKIKGDANAIIDGLKHTLIHHPRFSSISGMDRGKPIWVKTKVNVEDHVHVPDIDPAMEDPDQFLEDYVSNLISVPMDMSKPLWELHLLQLKTSDAESIGVLKIHHSLGDGMSLMSLLLACTRKTSDPEALPTVGAKKKHVGPSGFLAKIWRLVAGFWLFIRLMLNTCVDVVMSVLTMWFLKDTETPIRSKPGEEHDEAKRFIYRIISLDDVKLVKNAIKMTVNDVLVGITQAGLSRYLSRRYDRETTRDSKEFLKKIRLRGAVFMNLRPNTGIKDLADMMAKGSKCRWGNMIGYVLLPFWIGLEDDPLEYLRRAKHMMDRKKLSLEAVFSYAVFQFTMKIFGLKALEALTKKIFGSTTVSFSNMVGPDEEISFYGHPISYIAPNSFGLPYALTLHFQSYAKKMIISVAVDSSVISDPHQLCDDFVESLNVFKSIISKRGFDNNAKVKKVQ